MSATTGYLDPSAAAVARTALAALPAVDVAAALADASKANMSLTRIMFDMARLFRGKGRITPQEYIYYRLWELPDDERPRFIGKLVQNKMHLAATDPRWMAVADDKILFHLVCSGAGLPQSATIATICTTGQIPTARHLSTTMEIVDFFRRDDTFPAFIKPVAGMYSLGTMSLKSYDLTTDEIVFEGGVREAVTSVAEKLAKSSGDRRRDGYLVQRTLVAHPAIAERFGAGLWSVRIMALLDGAEATIVRAVCKIPAPGNWADNFWRAGNMLAAVDIETGRIIRVTRGTGNATEEGFPHPETGQPIESWTVPDWTEVIRIARLAATTTWGFRTQAWDIALTDEGPTLLEVNRGGDLNLVQLAYRKGALDATFAAHLARQPQ
jgi:hypothetical protein